MSYYHDLNIRVYYEDTDAGGIVYYASYMRFAERGRTENARDLHYPHQEMIDETGSLFVVRRVEADYLAPAYQDDLITIRSAVAAVGKTSVTMKQTVMRDDKTLVELMVTLVCMNAKGRATRIPEKALAIFNKAL